jgi:phage-related protein
MWLYNSIIKPYIDFWVTAFKVLEVVIWLVWTGVIQPVLNGFANAFIWLWDTAIKPVIDLIVAAWTNLWNTTVKPFVDFIVGALRVMGAAFSWLWASSVQPVINFIGDALHNLSVIFGVVFGGAANLVESAFGGVVSFVRGIFNNVIDIVDGIIGKINGVLSAGKAIGVNVQLSTIPHLATGGTMTRTGMALVGENGPEVVKLPAGATVYPHGSMPAGGSGSAVHIENFYAQPDQTPAQIGQELAFYGRWAT